LGTAGKEREADEQGDEGVQGLAGSIHYLLSPRNVGPGCSLGSVDDLVWVEKMAGMAWQDSLDAHLLEIDCFGIVPATR
jgi:hypothetical protein